MGPRRRRSFRQAVNCDLELRPLMNVFIVLIPMLLMSAVFIEVRVIEMSAPQAAEADSPAPSLDLAIRIGNTAYVITNGDLALAAVPRPSGDAAAVEAALLRLGQALRGIAASHPEHQEVRIVAGSSVRYQEIVSVMDTARSSGLSRAALEGAENGGLR